MRSSRGSAVAGLTLVVALATPAPGSAHRRDEYLQAARLAIDPDRVEIELDLTPGISVARDVLGQIDADADGAFSPAETNAYVDQVRRALTLELDGRPIEPRVVGSAFPSLDAIRSGEGAIRMRFTLALPQAPAGAHRLRYANRHRPDISVYLANALVPSSARVAVTDQQRDVDQRRLDVAYVLQSEPAPHGGRVMALSLSGAFVAAALWRASRRGTRAAKAVAIAASER